MKPPSMVLDADVNGFGAAKGKKKQQNKSGKKVLFLPIMSSLKAHPHRLAPMNPSRMPAITP